ncbi:MAG TPA: FAD-binding oxidoreductase [Vicinamibacterales bacterium]|nr:FAD-binding oxidoreductase [Vicinamibacterales bacterium]
MGTSIWLSRTQRRKRRYPVLKARQQADVVVVGAGLTGAAVTQRFAEAGVDVALVEADVVGGGSTAASTALLMQETDEELTELEERYGARCAMRIWELSRAATRDLVATVRRLDIWCDLAERQAIYYTTEQTAVMGLRGECRRRRQAGFSAEWVSPASLLSETGIAGRGAIRSTGNAQLDPYKACVGLLRRAVHDGARIFEQSAVRRIEATRGGVSVRTAKGAIAARCVIIATGFATPAFRPLTGRFRMKHTYVLATRPIAKRERAALGLGDVLLWEASNPYHYARWTSDHRLLLGGNDRPVVTPGRRRRAFTRGTRELRDYFNRLLPALKEIEIEFAWEGLFAMTPDGLPYIGAHRRYPHHLFALGYGGNGMTFGFLAARLLLDAFQNVKNDDLDLFAFNRHRAT